MPSKKVILLSEDNPYLVRFLKGPLTALASEIGADFTQDTQAYPPGSQSVLVQYGSYDDVAWGPVLNGRTVANSYMLRKGLIRKAHLAYNTCKWTTKYPSSPLAAGTPRTVWIECDDGEIDWAVTDVEVCILRMHVCEHVFQMR